MLKGTRVARTPDVHMISKALSRPGIDPRMWISCGYVQAVSKTDQGTFVDVVIAPHLDPYTCRVGEVYAGVGHGMSFPMSVDDEVLVALPNGDPNEGGVVICRLHSASDPPPSEVEDNPDDVVLHVQDGQSMTVVVESGGTINLGGTGLIKEEGVDGVVTGQGIDSFTGSTYAALGNSSTIVLAKKSEEG